MDIVDTFNHLIPTEHLDDALFLGSNLESECCEEFVASQDVIEDSLKNMLSDKDPMLGSASTQFCLPVLDSTDPNFQISSSTGVGLDDIMDVTDVKEADPNDEDDLILTNKDTSGLDEPSVMLRNSSRLIQQESSRSLRPEKHSSPVQVSSPTKSRPSRKVIPVEQARVDQDALHPENVEKRGKKTSNLEKTNTSPLHSRRSTRIANKELKEKSITEEENTQNLGTDKGSGEISSNTLCVLQGKVDRSETSQGDPHISPSQISGNILDVTRNDINLQPQNSSSDVQQKNAIEGKIDQEIYHCEKKADVIYDKVHKELALLSGVVECNLGVNKVVRSEIKSECSGENADGDTVQCKINRGNNLESSELESSSGVNPDVEESTVQTLQESMESEKTSEKLELEIMQGDEVCSRPNRSRRGSKKQIFNSAKSHLKPTTANTHKDPVGTVQGSSNSKTKQTRKKSFINSMESIPLNVESSLQETQKIVTVKKKTLDNIRDDNVPLANKALKRKRHIVAKEIHSHSSTQVNKLEDISNDYQGSLKETHAHSRARSSSYTSEKSAVKVPPPVSSKVNVQGKETGEHKETFDQMDEKIKLKKSIPPRQRRSSKSVSVDEPPLFIPDNIPNVKKEGAEVTSPTDKHAWNPVRHCSSCRKLHGNRFMVGCGRCDDWFHGECVGLSLSQAQQMEADDKEYICMKCCAEEEKVEVDSSMAVGNHQRIDALLELETSVTKPKSVSCPSGAQEKPKQTDDTTKHKVKISKKDLSDARHLFDRKDSEIKRNIASDRKHFKSATTFHRVSEEKREKSSKDSPSIPCHDEKTTKPGNSFNEKQDTKKKKTEKKGSSLQSSSPATPKPSVDQIRQSVRHSLKDILVKRLSESSLKVPEERATKVSAKIEKELFSFYRDTDAKYKNKYRSLMFNLKDPKNNVLFKRVLKGEIHPEHLIKMSPEELASRELAAWRQRENRHTIEMIEKEQREAERRPITKITHKGEIEIETDAPIKESESMDTEDAVIKPAEKEEEDQKDKDIPDGPTSDTTLQHKNHLFDLNCKICTGRMAPPAEDLSPKKANVLMGIIPKQSENEADIHNEGLLSSSTVLSIDALEAEKPESPKEPLSSTSSSEHFNIAEKLEDEATFLARLSYIWKGFLNMPSVAKVVVKAYPVSGSLEHLTEDLPESIQVGGRISPQTVWDYVDKIKASGTKETCLVRFCPVTEEDQISYTLLYSYFSSRKRYGVVANNMRLVKDMYLIPLGASEKIPHLFVPFDGPGLETHRPNLLLALIIRQKVKRQHSVNLDDEPSGSLIHVSSEKKNRIEISNEDDEEDDENDFFNSFTAVLHKNRNRTPLSDTDESQNVAECSQEMKKREPPKPLRFLPGVLVGWENSQSTLDLANKPLPVDDILQSLLGTTENKQSISILSSDNTSLLEETTDKMEVDTCFAETSTGKSIETESITEKMEESITKAALVPSSYSGNLLGLSLKGKPPDVSTEAFLANLNVQSDEDEVNKGLFDEPADEKHEYDKIANNNVSPLHEDFSKGVIEEDNASSSSENLSSLIKSPKPIHLKRDPRQAAVRTKTSSTDSMHSYISSKDENIHKENHTAERPSQHKRDKTKKQSYEETDLTLSKSETSTGALQFPSSSLQTLENSEKSKSNDKTPPKDLLIDDTDPLQQFRRALAANKSQSQSNVTHSETSSRLPLPAFGGNLASMRLQQPSFLPLKANPPAFPFQHTQSFPLQSNQVFPYTTQIPPLLPTPLGIGFPRPPRFPSAETGIHNPLVAWHPAGPLSRQPPPYLAQMTPGPLLGPEQIRYQGPQKLYHKDHRGPERRHSDPWDKKDHLLDRSLSRGSRGEHRQRFYSESHHSREKKHEKESDKNGDKDSERSRRRDRDKDRSHDRERKGRDESYRDRERSHSSHSDKNPDGKTHKEGRNMDKSKNEDRAHEREKNRDRNRDMDEEKERDRHHRDRDHSDKSKSKR
ncbi:PHD finger protein 3 [Spea bombifrons]|uniref:PHD finger protein 3 n=1 Tax=Spea bombifrons TaxID=233779 RepID=UPI002349B010|nr:PHD finger protein 3 [Spea bombifrons]